MANVNVQITGDAKGFEAAMTAASGAADGFGTAIVNSGNKAKTLKGALRVAKSEAQNLQYQLSQLSNTQLKSDIGQQLQAQFQQAIQAAGELQDQMSDVNQEISNIASDTMKWDAATQGIGILSSGFQSLASVVGLAGGNTESFAKALVYVNAVQGVSNTLTQIGNALQAQSALMVGLRAAKNAILGTSITAVTAAQTANTAATNTATVAQLANNAAVLANPYVAAAVAIAALVAGLAIWISSMDEATDSEIALGAAVDAFSEQVDSAMKTVGEQIALYDDLKRQYDECGDKTDEFSKKLINNTDVQKKLGVTVKSVDDVHRLFAKNSGAYADACMARASAMAAEAARAALLGATLAELSQIQAKLMAGQEVNWRDMRKLVEAMGYSADAADKLMKAAGYVYEGEGLAYGNIQKGTGDLTKLVQEITKGGAYKVLQDMSDQFKAAFDNINEIDFGGILTSNLNALDSGADKAGKSMSKAGKSAKKSADDIKKVLTSLEGCDAIIQQAEKDIKKLDSSTGDYQKKVEKLKNTILMARIAKLNLLDKSSVSGLMEARNLISQIMQSLPEGHPQLEKMREELKKCDEELYKMLDETAKSGSIKDLKELKSHIEKIIETLPAGSEELKKWVARLREVNGALSAAEEEVNNAKSGIEEGSKAWLEQQIGDIDKRMKDLEKQANPSISVKAELELQKEDLEAQLGEMNQRLKGVEVIAPEKKWWETFDTDFMNSGDEIKRLERCIDEAKEYLEYATQIKRTDVGKEKWDELQAGIKLANRQLAEFGKALVVEKIKTQIKEMNAELAKTSYDALKGGIDMFHNLYDAVAGLSDKLDECSNGFEGFFEIMSSAFTITDSIVSFIENIKSITNLINGLTAAKGAMATVNKLEAASNQSGTIAMEDSVVAAGEKAVSDTTAAAASETKVAALKTEGAALLEAASAQIFAAHAGIPFAGVGIASGLISEMMGTMAATKGAIMAMVAFEQGGIVQGSTTMGDNVIARLNAGEMVLNQTQQSRLFKMINSGNIGTNSGELSGTVRVKGSDLFVALNNYNKITGKKI